MKLTRLPGKCRVCISFVTGLLPLHLVDHIMDTANRVVREGWISKQSRFMKKWRRRWLVLTGTTLCSYKTERSYSSPTETIILKECATVKSAEEDTNQPHSFRVETAARVFFFVAEDAAEKEAWIGAIGRIMVRPTVMQDEHDSAE